MTLWELCIYDDLRVQGCKTWTLTDVQIPPVFYRTLRFMFCTPGPASHRSSFSFIDYFGVIAERILRCASSKLKVHITRFYQLWGRFVIGSQRCLTRFCIKRDKFKVQNAHNNLLYHLAFTADHFGVTVEWWRVLYLFYWFLLFLLIPRILCREKDSFFSFAHMTLPKYYNPSVDWADDWLVGWSVGPSVCQQYIEYSPFTAPAQLHMTYSAAYPALSDVILYLYK